MNRLPSFIIAALLLAALPARADDLAAGFRNPPETTKPSKQTSGGSSRRTPDLPSMNPTRGFEFRPKK